MASEIAIQLLDRLARACKTDVGAFTEDKPTINLWIGDAGEINIYATRVPVEVAEWVLPLLQCDKDRWEFLMACAQLARELAKDDKQAEPK